MIDPGALLLRPIKEGWSPAVAEETIFGIASRYHILSGNIISRETNFELTGNRSARLSASFPEDLPKFLSRLSLPINTVSRLIEKHTILPYFKPFTRADQYIKIFQNIENGVARFTKISLGLLAGRLGAKDLLRFCPECGKEDCKNIGVATWYRVHQLPGVLVCPYHGVPLQISFYSLHDKNREQLFLPGATKFSDNRLFPKERRVHDKLLLVARLSAQALLTDNAGNDLGLLRKQYLSWLCEKGLATLKLCHRKAAFVDEFFNFWSDLESIDPFSSLLACCREPRSWLTLLCNEPRNSLHPLKHLLLIGFFTNDMDSFLCHPIEMNVKVTSIPTRMSSDSTESRVRALFDEGKSVREIAAELGSSEQTVRILAARSRIFLRRRSWKVNTKLRHQIRAALAAGESLKNIMRTTKLSQRTIVTILNSDPELEFQRSVALQERRRATSRKKFLEAREKFVSASFWSLRAIVPADFSWLYSNDTEWLMGQAKIIGRYAVRKPVVDWGERDAILVEEVKAAVADILGFSGYPIRVRVSEIARRTRHESWVLTRRGRLPRTDILIVHSIESVEEYRERLLAWSDPT